MKPSDICRAAGLKGLAELSRIVEESEQTLNNWSKNKPVLFDVVVKGAFLKKREIEKMNDQGKEFAIHCTPNHGAQGQPHYMTGGNPDVGNVWKFGSREAAQKVADEYEAESKGFWNYRVKEF